MAQMPAGAERDACGNICNIRTSALTGAGCADLRVALAERFPRDHTTSPAPHSISTPALTR
jgi:hypothetical protein